jgi:hypothetical protein
MENIRKWLNGPRNYSEGVKLLLEHSQDEKLKKLFSTEGPTDFKKKKLHETLQQILSNTNRNGIKNFIQRQKPLEPELQKVLNTTSTRLISQTPTRLDISAPLQNPNKWPAQMDEVTKALFEKWKPIYAEKCNLEARIYEVAKAGLKNKSKEMEAGKMAHRILDLDDQCEQIYEQRNHYLKTGELPFHSKPSKLVVDPVKMATELKNAERYLREYKGRLKKNPADEKAAVKLKQYEEKIAYYKKELKLDNE